MSSDSGVSGARAPKRQRGKQRVAELLAAATELFAEKGYDAATMTEIAARAGAPIGSLYQFFPAKETLADTLLQGYIALLEEDLRQLEAHAHEIDLRTLVEGLFAVLRGHPQERAAALPLVEARMELRQRRATFRPMIRRHIAAILRALAPAVQPETVREMAVVVLQLMKADSSLSDEEGLTGRAAAQRELKALAVCYLEERLGRRP
jgi:AcrR family transcriptional regulator